MIDIGVIISPASASGSFSAVTNSVQQTRPILKEETSLKARIFKELDHSYGEDLWLFLWNVVPAVFDNAAANIFTKRLHRFIDFRRTPFVPQVRGLEFSLLLSRDRLFVRGSQTEAESMNRTSPSVVVRRPLSSEAALWPVLLVEWSHPGCVRRADATSGKVFGG